MTTEPLTFMFAGDGSVPNNPTLPVLLYRDAIDVAAARDPEIAIEQTFMANGWGHGLWRDSIFPYAHFHSATHEALGIARGRARVRLGGKNGEEVELTAGDVIVLPAGTGHQRLSEAGNLSVIGGYPGGGRYDLLHSRPAEHDRTLDAIANVPLPESDPLFGAKGPLLTLWKPTEQRR
jgi:uncharacterized protein YjlB